MTLRQLVFLLFGYLTMLNIAKSIDHAFHVALPLSTLVYSTVQQFVLCDWQQN